MNEWEEVVSNLSTFAVETISLMIRWNILVANLFAVPVFAVRGQQNATHHTHTTTKQDC